MTNIHLAGRLRYVADEAFFWLNPGEQRRITLRLSLIPGQSPTDLAVFARAWNCDPGRRLTATLE